ncbi:hydroxyisourate hydrolase [Methylobacterium oryzihabitans]|uniref:Hydroxyisourate hydrolase n=1 Tax=Methylobacterium oryzihabitans TaxID=2499852 RepID=A0A3S2YMU4_9HYPH|nr:hydroxyisourate hydrolase [Methylobacterium oryzihabitans]RVU14735.1 hydroxyisourate hydrolase [Methylobacterium oryzihabitans]
MTNGGISVHAVDVARGRPALGLAVTIDRLEPQRHRVAEGTIGPDGTLDHPLARGEGAQAGLHEVVFALGAYHAGLGADPGFLDAVPFRFRVADAAEHVHLPLKFTPYGYALFRGL